MSHLGASTDEKTSDCAGARTRISDFRDRRSNPLSYAVGSVPPGAGRCRSTPPTGDGRALSVLFSWPRNHQRYNDEQIWQLATRADRCAQMSPAQAVSTLLSARQPCTRRRADGIAQPPQVSLLRCVPIRPVGGAVYRRVRFSVFRTHRLLDVGHPARMDAASQTTEMSDRWAVRA